MTAKLMLLAVVSLLPLQAQIAADEPVVVFTEHPRLFLRQARLKLLKRERERASPRWQQL